ncbi:MAG: GNAT family N-acetyltransferase [Tistrella sp.]|uniref:GNAT family N-acetyltransferase n=1 Tax=Tistrella mobilis TaxID=171437 RepID=A0A3B9INS6_9PROT|nr:GNAT family N-acetyltransferase [Tistrella sp.]MAD39148.1 GNAT family N-acetyltransferase [Tistrella sp.]MBA73774.1 GNAT family N-acetyltransferase [Tistrella sp.]HAE48953.1 GNAT family N-acetyltransferase [Tistrella mobilis]|tara:strand:+ start:600 stop:1070 length:471 start_codon:yes stop_codon:yes gene_type:complete
MTADAPTIRQAGTGDAEAISAVILRALRETNAADYTSEIISAVAAGFSPEAITRLMAGRRVLVAVYADDVVGTASLDGAVVRSVFVSPDCQRRGIGMALMAAIEALARAVASPRLLVPSSVTAEGFYARLGFVALRDEWHGAERTIVMEKRLSPRA